jgi:hypothetical protein
MNRMEMLYENGRVYDFMWTIRYLKWHPNDPIVWLTNRLLCDGHLWFDLAIGSALINYEIINVHLIEELKYKR